MLTLVTPNRVQNSKQKWKQTNNETRWINNFDKENVEKSRFETTAVPWFHNELEILEDYLVGNLKSNQRNVAKPKTRWDIFRQNALEESGICE